jgi:hypothetical protein
MLMAHKDIILKGKTVGPHKAYMQPDFEGATVLVDNQFDYVELWLNRHSSREPIYYWQQAHNFYRASFDLPRESRPLTAYYCMLNAVKALLVTKNIPFSELHGVTGKSLDSKTSLANELCEIKGSGILVSLAQYFGANLAGRNVHLKDVLYNIPFVHRAYTITYRGTQNLFIPITDGHFVMQNNGHESWFCAKIQDRRYQKLSFFKKQRGWEIDESEKDFVIRSTHRFNWQAKGTTKVERMTELTKNHRIIRRDIKYIHGPSRLWYFKRNDKSTGILPWPTPALVFIVMYRLSELTRYDPKRLGRHFDCQHNWLLSEFLNLANDNFIDQISSEITGHEFLMPGYRE